MTAVQYPIIEHRVLGKAEKARWFGRKSLRADEIPRPEAHEALVYRVGSDFIVDNDRMSALDERIINATNVSVVDMRRDALIVAALTIPSSDASYFDVLVTFTCTVIDPMVVVKGGINACDALKGHLKAHNRIFELGLDFKLTQVNEVRRMVGAQVKAYLTHVPARVPGLQVRFANVEVSSPKAVMEFEDKFRTSNFAHRLDQHEQEYLQLKESGSAQHEHQLKRGRHALDLELDGDTFVHGQHKSRLELQLEEEAYAYSQRKSRLELELEEESHAYAQRRLRVEAEQDLWVHRRRSEHARAEIEANADLISDPKRALLAAYAAGQLDAQGLSSGLKALADSEREATMQEALARREETLALQASNLDLLRAEREWQQTENDRKAAEQRRQDDREYADKVEDKRYHRAVAERQQEMQFEMVKQMASQGQYNTTDVGADRLFAKTMDIPEAAIGRHESRAVGTVDSADTTGDLSGRVDEDES